MPADAGWDRHFAQTNELAALIGGVALTAGNLPAMPVSRHSPQAAISGGCWKVNASPSIGNGAA